MADFKTMYGDSDVSRKKAESAIASQSYPSPAKPKTAAEASNDMGNKRGYTPNE